MAKTCENCIYLKILNGGAYGFASCEYPWLLADLKMFPADKSHRCSHFKIRKKEYLDRLEKDK